MISWRYWGERLSVLRGWADQHVFPESPSPPKITLVRLFTGFMVGVTCVLLELARDWPSMPLRSIWAEDGATWLADAVHRGFLDALTTPYDGYLQTSSRILGRLVAALPVAWWAAGMAVAGALAVTGCAFVVWRASAGHISDPVLRGALAGLMILLPIADVELLDNVTNTIWFLMFTAFWVLLWRPATLTRAVLAAGVLLVAAITNVGVLALAPVWLLRLVLVRDRRDGVIVTAFAVGLSIQLGLSWSALNLSGEAGTIQGSLVPHWDWELIPAYLQRVAGGGVVGNTVAGSLWDQLGVIVELLSGAWLAIFLVVSARSRNPRLRLLVPLTVAISVVLFLVTGYQRWQSGGSQFLWPTGSHSNAFSRYLVVPSLLLLSALCIAASAGNRPAAHPDRTWPRVGATVLIAAALLSFNASNATLRGTPTWSSTLAAARSQCRLPGVTTARLPVNPTIIPGAFVVPLSCHELGTESATARSALGRSSGLRS